MLRYGIGLSVLLCLALAAVAQPDMANPDGPPRDPAQDQKRMVALMIMKVMDNMPAVQKMTPEGLFTARHGVLVKSDPATLEVKGTLELFGALPEWPKDGKFANEAAQLMAGLDRARRMALPMIAEEGKNLYLIIGADFLSIDKESMKIKASAPIFDPDPLIGTARTIMDGNIMAMMNIGSAIIPAQMEPHGKTVLVLRGSQQTVVDAETGAILLRKDLPAALTGTLVPPVAKVAGGGDMEAMFGAIGADPMAVINKAPEDGKTFLTIGALVPPAAADGSWTLKTWKGSLALHGEQTFKMAADKTTKTNRVLVYGNFQKTIPGMPAADMGYLETLGYLVLATAK